MNNQEHYKLKYLKYMFKYNELLHSTNFMEGGVNDGEVNDDVNNGEVNGDDNKTDPVEEQVVKDTAVAEEQVVAEEQAVEEQVVDQAVVDQPVVEEQVVEEQVVEEQVVVEDPVAEEQAVEEKPIKCLVSTHDERLLHLLKKLDVDTMNGKEYVHFKDCAIVLFKLNYKEGENDKNSIEISLFYEGEISNEKTKHDKNKVWYFTKENSTDKLKKFDTKNIISSDIAKYVSILNLKQDDVKNKNIEIYMITNGEHEEKYTNNGINEETNKDRELTINGYQQSRRAGYFFSETWNDTDLIDNEWNSHRYIFISDLWRSTETINKMVYDTSTEVTNLKIAPVYRLPCSHELESPANWTKSDKNSLYKCLTYNNTQLSRCSNLMTGNGNNDKIINVHYYIAFNRRLNDDYSAKQYLEDNKNLENNANITDKEKEKEKQKLEKKLEKAYIYRDKSQNICKCEDTSMIAMIMYILNNKNPITSDIQNWISARKQVNSSAPSALKKTTNAVSNLFKKS
jgi:hypothetical protein